MEGVLEKHVIVTNFLRFPPFFFHCAQPFLLCEGAKLFHAFSAGGSLVITFTSEEIQLALSSGRLFHEYLIAVSPPKVPRPTNQ